jgi:hypothetical protein
MTETLTETIWLLNGKNSLLRMRQELWLTEGEIAVVERGIEAIDRLVALQLNDRSGRFLAHHHASGCEQNSRKEYDI